MGQKQVATYELHRYQQVKRAQAAAGRVLSATPAAKICPLTPESSCTWQDAANFRSVGGAGSAIRAHRLIGLGRKRREPEREPEREPRGVPNNT